ncbi:MAG: c-type cytochrome [Gemmatimonadota bacterium]|nr:MAG: c-type cytochrome [Gemmatimonadota bacterium]
MNAKLWRPLTARGVLTQAVFVALVLGLPRGASPQEEGRLMQNPLAGSSVFGSKGCVKCHSVNGLGGTVGADLGRISQRRSFYDLAAAMWNHLPSMGKAMEEHDIARPEMSSREAGDLIAFLFTLDYFDPPGDVVKGKELFVEKKCVVCHQVGLYGGVIGPSLDQLSRYGSPILVAAAMWNHGPGMAELMEERGIKRPTFSGSELTDLISYLESVSPAPLEGPLYVLPGDPEEGRVLFIEKECIECHSVQAVGGRVGPDLTRRGNQWGLTEFAAAMWNKAPRMVAEMKRRGIHLPALGAGEMADLVAYLYSVQYFAELGDADRGRQLLSTKGCLACHSVAGAGGDTASDLARVSGIGSPAEVISALWNHSTQMEGTDESAWPTFTAQEMADVAAFMQRRVE